MTLLQCYLILLVLLSNQAPVAQEFLKRGSPRCLRGRLWAQVLGSAVKQTVRMHILRHS